MERNQQLIFFRDKYKQLKDSLENGEQKTKADVAKYKQLLRECEERCIKQTKELDFAEELVEMLKKNLAEFNKDAVDLKAIKHLRQCANELEASLKRKAKIWL